MSITKRPVKFGFVEVMCTINFSVAAIAIVFLLLTLIDKNLGPAVGMFVGLTLYPLWILTVIPATISAIYGLISARSLASSFVVKPRVTLGLATLLTNVLIGLYVYLALGGSLNL